LRSRGRGGAEGHLETLLLPFFVVFLYGVVALVADGSKDDGHAGVFNNNRGFGIAFVGVFF